MKLRDQILAQRIEAGLKLFQQKERPLLGISDSDYLTTFIKQLIESVHRVQYFSLMSNRDISEARADPNNEIFDPLKAAVLHQRNGNIDEAFWLVFLSVHFGKNARAGWRYAREVYGALGQQHRWDWSTTSKNPSEFRAWLGAHRSKIERADVPRGFGNHRKYESLNAYESTGTGAAVESYINWVCSSENHQGLINRACKAANDDPQATFDYLYRSMQVVARFGRTARFDYLCVLGNLQLAPINPGSTYMPNATGPLKGARLLFDPGNTQGLSVADLDSLLIALDNYLNVGMQVMEDSLCNWQKSPSVFKQFRG